MMKNVEEMEKSTAHIAEEIIEYVDNAVATKTITRKATGNISMMSFNSGQGMTGKISPFDTFAQIIDGTGAIVIDNVLHTLQTGMFIIIPAHALHSIKPGGRFKVMITIIKSGYE